MAKFVDETIGLLGFPGKDKVTGFEGVIRLEPDGFVLVLGPEGVAGDEQEGKNEGDADGGARASICHESPPWEGRSYLVGETLRRGKPKISMQISSFFVQFCSRA